MLLLSFHLPLTAGLWHQQASAQLPTSLELYSVPGNHHPLQERTCVEKSERELRERADIPRLERSLLFVQRPKTRNFRRQLPGEFGFIHGITANTLKTIITCRFKFIGQTTAPCIEIMKEEKIPQTHSRLLKVRLDSAWFFPLNYSPFPRKRCRWAAGF